MTTIDERIAALADAINHYTDADDIRRDLATFQSADAMIAAMIDDARDDFDDDDRACSRLPDADAYASIRGSPWDRRERSEAWQLVLDTLPGCVVA